VFQCPLKFTSVSAFLSVVFSLVSRQTSDPFSYSLGFPLKNPMNDTADVIYQYKKHSKCSHAYGNSQVSADLWNRGYYRRDGGSKQNSQYNVCDVSGYSFKRSFFPNAEVSYDNLCPDGLNGSRFTPGIIIPVTNIGPIRLTIQKMNATVRLITMRGNLVLTSARIDFRLITATPGALVSHLNRERFNKHNEEH